MSNLYVNTIQPFTGSSMTFTGSIAGEVRALSISSNTASMDLSTANFFTLTLVSGSTYINPTNIRMGQTVNLVLTTSTGSVVTFPASVKQVSGSAYTPTDVVGGTDVVTFLAPNTTTLLISNVNNLV